MPLPEKSLLPGLGESQIKTSLPSEIGPDKVAAMNFCSIQHGKTSFLKQFPQVFSGLATDLANDGFDESCSFFFKIPMHIRKGRGA